MQNFDLNPTIIESDAISLCSASSRGSNTSSSFSVFSVHSCDIWARNPHISDEEAVATRKALDAYGARYTRLPLPDIVTQSPLPPWLGSWSDLQLDVPHEFAEAAIDLPTHIPESQLADWIIKTITLEGHIEEYFKWQRRPEDERPRTVWEQLRRDSSPLRKASIAPISTYGMDGKALHVRVIIEVPEDIYHVRPPQWAKQWSSLEGYRDVPRDEDPEIVYPENASVSERARYLVYLTQGDNWNLRNIPQSLESGLITQEALDIMWEYGLLEDAFRARQKQLDELYAADIAALPVRKSEAFRFLAQFDVDHPRIMPFPWMSYQGKLNLCLKVKVPSGLSKADQAKYIFYSLISDTPVVDWEEALKNKTVNLSDINQVWALGQPRSQRVNSLFVELWREWGFESGFTTPPDQNLSSHA